MRGVLREAADEVVQPLEELKAFHDKHRGVGTVMGVKVRLQGLGKGGRS